MEKQIRNIVDYYEVECLKVCLDKDPGEIRNLIERIARESITLCIREFERSVRK